MLFPAVATTSSSSPRRQFTEAESDRPPSDIPAVPLSALRNQSSDFPEPKPKAEGSGPMGWAESGLLEKRNRRIREGFEELLAEAVRSYSSIMLSRSSSVVTEMRESRSSLGSWYLRAKGRPLRKVLERRVEISEREVWRSTTMMRVSPPT